MMSTITITDTTDDPGMRVALVDGLVAVYQLDDRAPRLDILNAGLDSSAEVERLRVALGKAAKLMRSWGR